MSSNHNDSKSKYKNTLGKSLERMMERHRRALAQSMAMVQRLQQQQEHQLHQPNLHHYHRHDPTLAAALAAYQQSQLLQDHQGFPFPKPTATTSTMSAPTELAENNECIRLTIDLPGVYKKDLKVHVERGNVLTVQAVRRTFSVSGQVCIKKQRIARSFAIDTSVVNLTEVSVTLENGVLTIQAPKRTMSNTRQQQQQQVDEASANCTIPDDDVKTKVSFDSLDIDQSSSYSCTRNNATTTTTKKR